MRIGIDIDEVVVRLIDGFFKFHKFKFGEDFFSEDVSDYYFGISKMMGLERDAFLNYIDEFYFSDFFDEIEMVDFAKEVIDKLSEEHELFFITSRNTSWQEKTYSFFKKNFPLKSFEVIFSGDVYENQNKSKEEICREKGIKVIVEDSAEHSPDYADKGLKVLLLDKPWNRDVEHENITRVRDWNDILEKIKEIENGVEAD